MSSVPPLPEIVDQQLGGERRIVEEKASTRIRVTCSHDRNGRIIVISADGTSNEFGEKSTNVVEFYSRIVKGKKQITFYISGIGTHTTSKLGRLFDLAFANSFERNVLLAYKWLAENYEAGDRIFLFGFSRGAYQVRVIAGMIERVGLIYPGNNTQLPAVYKLYMSTTERSSGKGTAKYDKAMKLCGTFKKAFSQPNVKVHFVGVWDTVSSIGLARGASLPETVTGMSHVCHFRHALALDERRVRFWPEHASTSVAAGSKPPEHGDVKEVWFAGSHSDIGGGNVENSELTTFGPALRWMTYEAMDHGLAMEPYHGTWGLTSPTKSLKAAWRILEGLPMRRPSYEGDKITRKPHYGAPRRIQKQQYIHESVFKLMGMEVTKPTTSSNSPNLRPSLCPLPLTSKSDALRTRPYAPYGVLPGDHSWDDNHFLAEIMEQDPFEDLDSTVSRIETATTEKDLDRLQSEIDVLATNVSSNAHQNPSNGPINEVFNSLPTLLSALDFLATQEHVRSPVILTLFQTLALLPPNKKHKTPFSIFNNVARRLDEVSKSRIHPKLLGVLCHASELLRSSYDLHDSRRIESVAIPAPDKVVFASPKKVMIQAKGAETPFSIGDQHTVSFSANGSKFATGDGDGTVKIWDTETGKELRTFEGHSHAIYSLAFSPDGRKIAAGSWDSTIRVWDAETGRDLFGAMEGHTRPVSGLAFSPDGTRLASGSWDGTVRLWDEAGKSKVLEGQGGPVLSVAFSKDHIISGSLDDTIRVWDAGSGDLVRVLRGHTSWVRCVAFSPDFKLVASGSGDGTARLWDVSSGEVLAIYDVGEGLSSIAFSFDGKQVVTGSARGKAHIWNADVLL